MKIAPAEISDIDQIVKLWNSLVEFHTKLDPVYYSPYDDKYSLKDDQKYISDAIKNGEPSVIVAKEGDSVIGFVVVDFKTEKVLDTKLTQYGEITDVFVDSKYRHHGLATSLINFAEKYIQSKGYKNIKIQVSAFNINAINLYRNLGYIDRQHFMFKAISTQNFIQKTVDFISSIFKRK